MTLSKHGMTVHTLLPSCRHRQDDCIASKGAGHAWKAVPQVLYRGGVKLHMQEGMRGSLSTQVAMHLKTNQKAMLGTAMQATLLHS